MLLLAGLGSHSGTFEHALREIDPSLGTEDVAAFAASLILANVLRRTREAMEGVFPRLDPGRELSVNLDVPIDHLHPPAALARFEAVLDDAIAMAESVGERMPLRDALDVWRHAISLRHAFEVPASERRAFVVPEAIAMLGGLSGFAAPVPNQNYAVVDVGAGTTDIGIFRVVEIDTQTRIPFYAASTAPIGGNDIDRVMAEQLVPGSSEDPELTATLRHSKHALTASQIVPVAHNGVSLQLLRNHLHGAIHAIAQRWRRHFSTTFGQAISRDRNTGNWREVTIIVVGGGALATPLPSIFERLERQHAFCTATRLPITTYARSLPEVVGASTISPAAAELPLLVASVGLARPVALMPEFVNPKDVPVQHAQRHSSGAYEYDAVEAYD
jgi:hypothetical protein